MLEENREHTPPVGESSRAPTAALEEVWYRKSDSELLEAVVEIVEYTVEARRAIVAEASRRGLKIRPLIEATIEIQDTENQEGTSPCACSNDSMRAEIGLLGLLAFSPIAFLVGLSANTPQPHTRQCRADKIYLAASRRLPDPAVQAEVSRIHEGDCSRCGGLGPLDIHDSHRVWSVLLFTFPRSREFLSCSRCASKQRIKDTIFSALLGWWGFPLGPIMTPAQIFRNVYQMLQRNPQPGPSDKLERAIRLAMAERMIAGEMSPPGEPVQSTE